MRRVGRRSEAGAGQQALAFGLMIAASIVTWAPAAGAQQGGGDGIEAFREHVSRGAELRKQEKYRQALERFEQAREIADHPKLMLATANLREAIGDCAGARDEMRRAIEDGRGSKELHKKLVAALEENRQCVSRGQLVVVCEPASTKLRVSRREVACGDEIELTSGTHMLTARAEGYRDLQEQVRVVPGDRQRHRVRLIESASAVGGAEAANVPAWMRYGAYGGVGAGAALVVAGLVSDMSATDRQDEMQQAQMSGDLARTRRLVREGESARARTVALYASGAILATAGGLLWAYDEEVAAWLDLDAEAAVRPQVHLDATEASIGAAWSW